MALPTLDATFASSVDLPRRQMLARWLVEESGEAQAPSDVLVSGLSDTQFNGRYLYNGIVNGRPSYNRETYFIRFVASNSWVIIDEAEGGFSAASDSDVAYPWLAVDCRPGRRPGWRPGRRLARQLPA